MESALSVEKADSLANATEMLQQLSSPAVKRSWFAVPIGFYQEETSVGFGATGGYYFKSHDLSKISIRNARRDAIDALKKSIKDGMPEDVEKDAEADVQKVHDKFIKRIDEMVAEKEKEIMTV